ncbi:hypothetical protein [Campylobacter helveticus]|uniref:hypothetical protein n=1 Tax=Campylobacter helveticus TaxID=28898 RepID=UPI00214A2437|nr:hypothetical protein [Campylobacter helveticus]MCR2064915.1 hypothetical protein [Campylobacter helveticus]
MKRFALLFLALFLGACTNKTFVRSAVEINNEGIFIKAKQGESFKILFHNASSTQSELAFKLSQSLQNLGLKEVKENPTYEILLNYIDFKKHSYAQRVSTSADFFFNLDPLESKGEWLVENFYTLQVNIQIQSQNATQQTSLLARTAYLSDKPRCQLSLEDKIIRQIVSFFYLD